MELTFTDTKKQIFPTLGQLLSDVRYMDHNGDIQPVHRTFIYDGFVYAVVKSVGDNIDYKVQTGYAGCLNLKSQTVRAIPLNVQVEPVEVEVIVSHPVTHRYK